MPDLEYRVWGLIPAVVSAVVRTQDWWCVSWFDKTVLLRYNQRHICSRRTSNAAGGSSIGAAVPSFNTVIFFNNHNLISFSPAQCFSFIVVKQLWAGESLQGQTCSSDSQTIDTYVFFSCLSGTDLRVFGRRLHLVILILHVFSSCKTGAFFTSLRPSDLLLFSH